MSDVYANGEAIACKAGDGKVIAAFPDVCLSPPSPPAGPIPVPYPNTSFSKDMKNGSKSVKIKGKEIMLKDQSFYKSSPLGDEAATRSFGANVLTHVITGKTYFGAWSMDVKVEGKNVPRHIDLTTSNHASYPGGSGPMTNAEKMALERIAKDKCPCCDGPKHAEGTPMNRDEWYESELQKKRDAAVQRRTDKWKGKMAGKTSQKKIDKIQLKLDGEVARINQNCTDEIKKYRDLIQRTEARVGCSCPQPKPDILPSAPCDVFFESPDDDTQREAQHTDIEKKWMDMKAAAFNQDSADRPSSLRTMQDGDEYMHKTPKAAGGCPTGDGNLQRKADLCNACQELDNEYNDFQGGWR